MSIEKEPRETSPDSRTGRRAFCRTAAFAALGLWSVPALPARATRGAFSPAVFDPEIGPEEVSLAKTVKAVTAKVVSVKGECGIHRAGDTCTFTAEGVQGEVCIHALYSMLPKVFAMMYGATFAWLKDPDVASHACPDAANPVVFEISREYA